MGFNLKGKGWAESFYHQFESICQDVDGFVNKDTAKHVGNQVQNVGVSVVRLCSNVLQNKLPISGDIAKPKKQLAAGEKCGGIQTSTCTDEEQFPKNKVSDDHKMRISKAAVNAESQTCQHSTDGNAIFQNSEVDSSAENVTKDLASATAISSSDSEIFSRDSDFDYISTSAHAEDFALIEQERSDCNNKKGATGFTDDMVCLSETSIGLLSKIKVPVIEDPYVDENESLSSPPLPVSSNEDKCPLMDSDDQAFDAEVKSVDLSISEHMPSTTSLKFSISMESASADVEKVLHSCSLSDGCIDNISAASPIIAADRIKPLDVDPFFPLLDVESNDNNTLQIDRSEFVISSSESQHEENHKDGLLEIALSPSETDELLDLETVDLFSNVKHDDSYHVSSSKLALPGSYRRKDFRYYKGAFTCKKRLAKEYEHLAILYGDIDVESNRHFEQSCLSNIQSLKEKEKEMIDKWELL